MYDIYLNTDLLNQKLQELMEKLTEIHHERKYMEELTAQMSRKWNGTAELSWAQNMQILLTKLENAFYKQEICIQRVHDLAENMVSTERGITALLEEI